MLTGDDISLAMDHLQSSKAETTETSLSSLNLPHPEELKESQGRSSRIHKELRILLADEEDCDRIQKHSGFNTQNDELDGAFEGLNLHPSENDPTPLTEPSSLDSSLFVLPALSMALESSTNTSTATDAWVRERAVWGRSGTMMQASSIQHLDGIAVSLPEDDWYGSRSDFSGLTDDIENQSEGITEASTPLLSPSGSIVSGLSGPSSNGPETPSPRPLVTGISLRGGAAPGELAPEYYVTSTCPEFVGPSEPFSLISEYRDQSRLSTMVRPPTPLPLSEDSSSLGSSTGVEHGTLLTPPESRPTFRRRGLGTYDNASNLEHTGSVFSPFSYSPEEPDLEHASAVTTMTPSPPSSEWNGGGRDQEGGATWDLRGSRT